MTAGRFQRRKGVQEYFFHAQHFLTENYPIVFGHDDMVVDDVKIEAGERMWR